MRGLSGKTIIVVAAGTNHGRPSLGGAVCGRLAAEGAHVVAADIDLDAAQLTVDGIHASGGSANAVFVDASNEASIQSLIDGTVATRGALHGVHFNAMDMSPGALGADGEHNICTLPLDVWQRSIDVGLTGFFLTAKYAIPHLVAAGGGGIVCTASDAVYVGEPIRLAYAATKTGMQAVVRHIASAYGQQGVRANAIAPGLVLGDAAVTAMGVDRASKMLRIGRSNRLGQPEDIANAVTFLLSDDGEWINGQTIKIDGGTVLGI